MNKERVAQFISDLETSRRSRGDFIYMCSWQFRSGGSVCRDIREFHSCGNKACAGGFLALTEQFQDAGGSVAEFGTPSMTSTEYFGTITGSLAFAEFFGINLAVSRAITEDMCGEEQSSDFTFFNDASAQQLQRRFCEHVGEAWGLWDVDHLINLMSAILTGKVETTVHVPSHIDADTPNEELGDAYGVDWVYDHEVEA